MVSIRPHEEKLKKAGEEDDIGLAEYYKKEINTKKIDIENKKRMIIYPDF